MFDEQDLAVLTDEERANGHVHGEAPPRGEVPALSHVPQGLGQLIGFVRVALKVGSKDT
ncbi:hypothetical protein ABT288_32915 [Streptomyces sp. NPDC001093]|uniref:hypothetical protein n=1 Tax=Streptomyces sp. NPDC001093 TaxID=3154376 RepID=UPI00331823E6